ncbi:MAG: ABC transporter permease [Phycisphaerales bacterium]|nr:ABC transporter permease [Phycisphaerales bacterium]
MQTIAIFVAAYRELSARRLFWLALGTTLLVVGIFASVGINEIGLTLFGLNGASPFFNTNAMSPETFYKLFFVKFGIEWWLGMLATVLALVTTCGIVPDLVAPGSIDLILAKPISRPRLFLTKYATGLLFAALQVLIFSTAVFFVIGIRGGAWEWALFLAVPIVTFFYSLLFSICAMVGMVTRSSIASLILTVMAWAAISAVTFGEWLTNQGLLANTMDIVACERVLADTTKPPDEDRRAEVEERLAHAMESRPNWLTAHGWFYWIYVGLPKTAETLDAMERVLIDTAKIPSGLKGEAFSGPRVFEPNEATVEEFQAAVHEQSASRSLWWVLGTSLAFEAVMLWIATAVFVRRDY